MKSAHIITPKYRRVNLAVLVLLVAALSLLTVGVTGCATVSKGMENLKRIMHIYDIYERPAVEFVDAIAFIVPDTEEEETE